MGTEEDGRGVKKGRHFVMVNCLVATASLTQSVEVLQKYEKTMAKLKLSELFATTNMVANDTDIKRVCYSSTMNPSETKTSKSRRK